MLLIRFTNPNLILPLKTTYCHTFEIYSDPVHSLPASVSPLLNFFQASCVSSITSPAALASNHFSSNPNPFSGLSSGVLYHLNHSRIPSFTASGTSSISLYSFAKSSSVATAITYSQATEHDGVIKYVLIEKINFIQSMLHINK